MNYQSAKVLKGIARDKMLGKYGTAIGAFLFLRFILLVGLMFSSALSGNNAMISFGLSLVFMLIEGIFVYGELSIYLKISVGMETAITDIFSAFKSNADRAIKARLIYVAILYGGLMAGAGIEAVVYMLGVAQAKAVAVFAWLVIAVMCCYLLLIYSQVLYYLQDFSDITVKEACRRSRNLMKGNMKSLFLLYLSFIPLYVVGALSFFVGLYYIHPYVKMTLTEFYLDRVRQEQSAKADINADKGSQIDILA